MIPLHEELHAPLSSHIDQLKKTLIFSLLWIGIGISTCFYWSQDILLLIKTTLPLTIHGWVILAPQEGIVTLCKISVWLGVFISSPFWLSTILCFILPALKKEERRVIPSFLILSTSMVGFGLFCALKWTLPFANEALYAFNEKIGINEWRFVDYIDYVLSFVLIHAGLFELGATLLLLIQYEIITVTKLIQQRKTVFIVALLLGAILTPPDIFSQLAVALPIYAFYELAILYGKYFHFKKNYKLRT